MQWKQQTAHHYNSAELLHNSADPILSKNVNITQACYSFLHGYISHVRDKTKAANYQTWLWRQYYQN